MGLFDQIVLLVTGLIALYLVWRFYQHFSGSEVKPACDVYYMISFLVLLVAGLLLIFFGYDVLSKPLVVIVAYLIPLGLSLGLVAEFYPRQEKLYLAVGIIGLLAIAITRLGNVAPGLGTFALAFFHSIAGLIIFFVPILAVKAGKAPRGFLWVTVGGVLIGIGGIALAFLKAGAPILPAEFIFTILAPLLLLMTLAYTYGFVKKMIGAH